MKNQNCESLVAVRERERERERELYFSERKNASLKYLRNNKGSVTLFVLIAMIFFLAIAMSSYVSAMNKLQAQNDEIDQIIAQKI